jgi:hypothetical protein
MNKQEALVAFLEKARQWEHADAEVKREAATQVSEVLYRNVDRLRDMENREVKGIKLDTVDVDAALICVGAAVLYLLVDEVTVVQPERTLDEWLAGDMVPGPGNRRGMAFDRAEHDA